MDSTPPSSCSYYDSYPPVFRPKTSPWPHGLDQLDGPPPPPPEPKPHTPHGPDSDPLPIIDLQNMSPNDLAEACQHWGAFRLVNHGVPNTLLNQLLEQTKEIFSLPFESKYAQRTCRPMAYFFGDPVFSSDPVVEKTAKGEGDPRKEINWTEGFTVVLNQLSQLQAEDPKIDNFRLVLEEYGRHQSRLAKTIFKAMAENLNLDQQQSETYLTSSSGAMRVIRYLRCCELNQSLGLDAHTDSAILAILAQDEVGGLQVCKGDDEWLDVKPISDTLIVILGDIAQAMSDDKYKASKHRVKTNTLEERISAAYFWIPSVDVVIRSSKYKPFTFADFREAAQQDTKTIGYKKLGLGHFKITQ